MKKITILDTSISTTNLGDEIIVDAVSKQLNTLFNQDMFLRIPTHDYIGRQSHKILNQSDFKFVAGTNLLNAKYNFVRSNAWKLKISDIFKIKDIILLGVGWGEYQNSISLLSRYMYKNVLHSKIKHSVRDSYTKSKLESVGITNVLNTGCATMWDLTPEHCSEIPIKKAENVVFTLTDYGKDKERDQQLINILRTNYSNVYFWVQGSKDLQYLSSLESKNIIIIPPKLAAYDHLLESNLDLDFVGTRLHAGIRAMQKKRRTLILGIDNRALEKKKDFNINVLNRENIDKLEEIINGEIDTKLTIDFDAITEWKAQFKNI